jgi:UDPglucose 6-dehydrogenase
VEAVQDPIVAVLGLAFKPNTDDVRGSPALAILQRLLKEGITVRAHDPMAIANASRALLGVDYRPDPYSALDGADVMLLATEWEEYSSLDWPLIRESMRGKTVIDGRNVLDGALLAELGFRYWSFGRPGQHKSNGNTPDGHSVNSTPGIREAGV